MCSRGGGTRAQTRGRAGEPMRSAAGVVEHERVAAHHGPDRHEGLGLAVQDSSEQARPGQAPRGERLTAEDFGPRIVRLGVVEWQPIRDAELPERNNATPPKKATWITGEHRRLCVRHPGPEHARADVRRGQWWRGRIASRHSRALLGRSCGIGYRGICQVDSDRLRAPRSRTARRDSSKEPESSKRDPQASLEHTDRRASRTPRRTTVIGPEPGSA